MALTVGSMLLLVGIQLLAPWLIKTMIATVTDPKATPEAVTTVARLALLALAVYIARTGLLFVRSYMAHVAGWNVVADVRSQIYQHLQRLSLRFYEDKQTGQLMSRTVNDSDPETCRLGVPTAAPSPPSARATPRKRLAIAPQDGAYGPHCLHCSVSRWRVARISSRLKRAARPAPNRMAPETPI